MFVSERSLRPTTYTGKRTYLSRSLIFATNSYSMVIVAKAPTPAVSECLSIELQGRLWCRELMSWVLSPGFCQVGRLFELKMH